MNANQVSSLGVWEHRRNTFAHALEIALVIVIGVAGVLMAHHPMLLSGFHQIQTDLGDSRFNHYMLEHGYRWMLRERGHESLWNPPFYYPASNAAAYSDLLLGFGPVYWLWRFLGAPEELSFGLWMVSMSVLNYLAGLLLFRVGFRFGLAASAGGAALVAFGAPRMNQVGHQQLLPCFYVIIAVYCLAKLADLEPLHRRRRAGYWLIAALALVAQLYSGIYIAWFFAMATVVTVSAATYLASCRARLISLVRNDAWIIFGVALIGLLLLTPLLDHYGRVAHELKFRVHYLLTVLRQPQVWSWFSMGGGNWFWGWTASREPFRSDPFGGELCLGIGILTLPICGAGLIMRRKWPISQLATALIFVIWLIATRLPDDVTSLVAMVVSLYCVAVLYHERDEGVLRALAVILIVIVELLRPYRTSYIGFSSRANDYLDVLRLSVMVFACLSLAKQKRLFGQAVTIVVLSVCLFPIIIITKEVAMAFLFWVTLSYLFRDQRKRIGATLGWLLLGLLAYTAFGDRPRVLVGVAVGVPISLALTSSCRFRPPAPSVMSLLFITAPLVVIFYGVDSLWWRVYDWIPGGTGIRVLARVILIMLIPMAVGLACFVESLERKRWRIAGWALVFVCLAEQLVTTGSYDAADNQSRIQAVAVRVDRSGESFFYYPADRTQWVNNQLDAMWASLSTRVPTVNGYSGYHPSSWNEFNRIDTKNGLNLSATLEDWEKRQGLALGSVQLIGEYFDVSEGKRTHDERSNNGLPPSSRKLSQNQRCALASSRFP